MAQSSGIELNSKWISEIIRRIKDPTASEPLRPSLSEEKGNEIMVVRSEERLNSSHL